jgi:Sec-independent protein translocase protein TatA
MVLFPGAAISNFMQLLPIPFSFRVFILILAGLHLLFALTAERLVFPVIASWIGKLLQGHKKMAQIETQEQQQQQNRRPPAQQQSQRVHQTYRIDDGDDEADESGSRPSTPLMFHPEDLKGKSYKPGTKIYKMVEEEMNEE